jgi:hypothetical protein
MKRRTEVFIETERLVLLRGASSNRAEFHLPKSRMWCGGCAKRVEPLTTDEAAILTQVSSRSIFHQIQAGLIHYMENAQGLLFVCSNSLQNRAR